jgi:hypothetical protein
LIYLPGHPFSFFVGRVHLRHHHLRLLRRGPHGAGPQWPSTVLRSASFRPPRRRGILPGMSTRPRSQAGPPMTLGNMRANGVRSLAVSCHLCHHQAVLSADPWPDHVAVPSAYSSRAAARCACSVPERVSRNSPPSWSTSPFSTRESSIARDTIIRHCWPCASGARWVNSSLVKRQFQYRIYYRIWLGKLIAITQEVKKRSSANRVGKTERILAS